MSYIYTRANFKDRVNSGIHNRSGMILDFEEVLNDAASFVASDIDTRSLRRKTALDPKIFTGIYEYGAPADLDALKIISLPPQILEKTTEEIYLIPSEEFDRDKPLNGFAIDYFDGGKLLKVVFDTKEDGRVISSLDTTTSGGTWSAYGDAENIARDYADFIKGAGSIKFGINASGNTTAGIVSSNLVSFDLTDFLGGNGALFTYHKISNKDNITNYKIRIGNDASNYYEKTITARHDGNAFENGWNLLRFDLSNMGETGNVDNTQITYLAIYMTKTTGKISETDYKFDHVVIKNGTNYYVKYYSKYPWISSVGARKENATDDFDYLVADADEFRLLYIPKAVEMAARELKDYSIAQEMERLYKENKKQYEMRNPSEAKIMTSEYHAYETY